MLKLDTIQKKNKNVFKFSCGPQNRVQELFEHKKVMLSSRGERLSSDPSENKNGFRSSFFPQYPEPSSGAVWTQGGDAERLWREREIYFYAGRPFTCLLVVTGSQQEQNVSNSASSHDLQISQELYEHGGGTWHLRRDGSFACFLVVIGSQQQQNGFRSSFLFCQQVFGVCQQGFVLVIWVFN